MWMQVDIRAMAGRFLSVVFPRLHGRQHIDTRPSMPGRTGLQDGERSLGIDLGRFTVLRPF